MYVVDRFSRMTRLDAGVLGIYGLFAVGMLFFEYTESMLALNIVFPITVLLLCAVFMAPVFLEQKKLMILWCVGVFAATWGVEVLGVYTGGIFGVYTYGEALGPVVVGVPLLIGLCWVIVVLGAVTIANGLTKNKWFAAGLAALIAVGFDLLMEPLALELGLWSWQGGGLPPVQNYIGWFVVSFVCALAFNLLGERTTKPLKMEYLAVPLIFLIGSQTLNV